jgi:hypothetical protein
MNNVLSSTVINTNNQHCDCTSACKTKRCAYKVANKLCTEQCHTNKH